MTIPEKLNVFLASMDPDKSKDIVLACHLEVNSIDEDQPLHQHHKGQLLFVLHGSMTCETPDKIWLIPHHCAVWIPGNKPHRVKSRGGVVAYYLFIEPEQCRMPDTCRMYSISPLVREMLISLVVDDAMLYEKKLYQPVAEILLRLLPESPVISLQIQPTRP